jgi:cytochrome c554/c'-like protein
VSERIRWIGLGVVAMLVLALGYLLAVPGATTEVSGAPATGSVPLDRGSAVCRPCHADVWAEWSQSYHAMAFVDPEPRRPELSDGFKNKDCIPCHAPEPVLETGIGNRALARRVFLDEGVDCLACHRVGGGVATVRSGVSAPCNPVATAALGSVEHCAICHDQHNTVGEWRATAFAKSGADCLACHMPAIEREPRAPGAPKRKGRDHRSLAAHDPKLLASSSDVSVAVAKDAVSLAVTNTRCGHNFPTDERHRAVDLVTTFADAEGRERAEHRERFRNPYRDEVGLVDTQIRAGDTKAFRYEVPFGATTVRVRLYYKLTPITPDAEGSLLFEREERIP